VAKAKQRTAGAELRQDGPLKSCPHHLILKGKTMKDILTGIICITLGFLNLLGIGIMLFLLKGEE